MVVKLQFSCLKFWRPPSRTVLFGQGNRNSNFRIFLLDLHNNPDQLLNQQSLYYSKKCSFKSDINPLCHLVHSESSGDVERNCRLSLVGLKLDSQERLPCFLHIPNLNLTTRVGQKRYRSFAERIFSGSKIILVAIIAKKGN